MLSQCIPSFSLVHYITFFGRLFLGLVLSPGLLSLEHSKLPELLVSLLFYSLRKVLIFLWCLTDHATHFITKRLDLIYLSFELPFCLFGSSFQYKLPALISPVTFSVNDTKFGLYHLLKRNHQQ